MLYGYVTNCEMINYSKWATVLNSVQVINPLFWTQWKRHIIPFIIEIAFWTPHVLAWPWLFWCEARPYQGLQPKEIFRKERRGENRGFVFIILWYCAVKTCHLSGYSCIWGLKMVMKNSLCWAYEVTLLPDSLAHLHYVTHLSVLFEKYSYPVILLKSVHVKGLGFYKLQLNNLLNLINLLP